MLDEAYTSWWRDVHAGRHSLLIASSGEEASALAARARVQRVATGVVEPDGLRLHDGNTAGVGDWIVTRANMRLMRLNGGRDFVKNGDTWTVTQIDKDGSLVARHLRHGAETRLPAAYVERDVELAYAVTAHRAQGMTVDTAHTLVTDDTTREALYVAATRGRHRNHVYEVTDATLHADVDPPTKAPRAPYEVLHVALDRGAAALSATETIRAAHERDTRAYEPKRSASAFRPDAARREARCLGTTQLLIGTAPLPGDQQPHDTAGGCSRSCMLCGLILPTYSPASVSFRPE